MSFDTNPPAPKKSKLPLILGILGVSGLAVVACCGGAAYFGFGMVTAPRDAAIEAMEHDAALSEKLGTPLKAGSSFSLSNYQNNNNNGSAVIEFNVEGPNGTASVEADMKLTAGTWSVKLLTAQCSDGSTVTIPADAPAEAEAEPDGKE